MDPVIGGLIAAAAAWASILLAIHTPVGARMPPQGLRRLGAVTIALLALQVLGLSVPGWLPLSILGGGLVVLFVVGPRGHAAAA